MTLPSVITSLLLFCSMGPPCGRRLCEVSNALLFSATGCRVWFMGLPCGSWLFELLNVLPFLATGCGDKISVAISSDCSSLSLNSEKKSCAAADLVHVAANAVMLSC